MKTILLIATMLASCCVTLADTHRHQTPCDFTLDCTPTDTNRTSWVAKLQESGKTNSYQFTDMTSLIRFVEELPDRSRIWYGFEEPPENVHAGKEKMTTHVFRAMCNFHGVILSWRVGW